MRTFRLDTIATDALPTLCAGGRCLNDPQPGSRYCVECEERKRRHYRGVKAVRLRFRRDAAWRRVEGFDGNMPGARVYVLQEVCVRRVNEGLVKIGWTPDLRQRLSTLVRTSRQDLRLLAAPPGNRELEQLVHQVCWKHRVRGEWFRPAAEVLDFVQAAKTISGLLLWVSDHWFKGA